jgi:hypothetical protein
LDGSFLEGSPETYTRSVNDSIEIQEGVSGSKQAASSGSGGGSGGSGKVARSVSDEVAIDERLRARDREARPEPPAPSLYERSIADSLGVEERMFLSGSVVPPSAPELIVPGSRQSFNMESAEAAVITFISSSSGTYRIDVENDAGERVAAISGQMAAGENNARWPGTDRGGDPVPDGTYTYYITANNDVGTRTPPAGGDGTILVSGAPAQETPAAVDWTPYAVIAPVLAAGGAGAFLFSRRRNRLVVYLPAGAAPVIEEIRERYPRAEVGEYVSPHEDGSEVVKGVSIPSPRQSDEEWFGDIIRRAKELAGVDSINISHRGRVHPV